MNQTDYKRVAGFTMIELLITIIVIGLLATIGAVGYDQFRIKARDHQRFEDTTTIVKALRLFKVDNVSFPHIGNPGYTIPANCVMGGSEDLAIFLSDTQNYEADFLDCLVTDGYLSTMPLDPRNATVDGTTHYYYYINDWWGYSCGDRNQGSTNPPETNANAAYLGKAYLYYYPEKPIPDRPDPGCVSAVDGLGLAYTNGAYIHILQ